ncbi:hypothetical protein SNK05_013590 [Fusarium graminearum]
MFTTSALTSQSPLLSQYEQQQHSAIKMYGRCTAVLGIMTLVNAIAATAQNLSFGADNFYRSESLQTQPITFPTHVETPAIVVGHPMGAVKEQSVNLYATKLAEQGFITISIDLPTGAVVIVNPATPFRPNTTQRRSAPQSTTSAYRNLSTVNASVVLVSAAAALYHQRCKDRFPP